MGDLIAPASDGGLQKLIADVEELKRQQAGHRHLLDRLTVLAEQPQVNAVTQRGRTIVAPQGYSDPGGYTTAELSPLFSVAVSPPTWARTGAVVATMSAYFPHEPGDVPALEMMLRISTAFMSLPGPVVFGVDNLARRAISASSTLGAPVDAKQGPVTVLVAAKAIPVLAAGPVDLSAFVIWIG